MTLTATIPARSAASTTIQSTPPVTGRRARSRFREPTATRSASADINFHRGAQPGGAGTRVRGGLGGRRADRLAGEQPKLGLASADADRQLRRAGAALRRGGEEPLHDAVLERVKADHR